MPEMYPNVDNMPDPPGYASYPLNVRAALDAALAEEVADGAAEVLAEISEYRSGQIRARDAVDANEVATANSAVRARAVVRNLANAERVLLANITGTGVGGSITIGDVQSQALLRQPLAAATAAGGQFPHPTAATVTERGTYPGWVDDALKVKPEPTLFATGNLPPFTASGIDVSELMSVPWPARPAMALARTRREAYELAQEVASLPAETAEADALKWFARDDLVNDYINGLNQWLWLGQMEKQKRNTDYSVQRLAGGSDTTRSVGR